MEHRDFYLLMNRFNTVPGPIQNYGDFCDAFERIAHNSNNADDFRDALKAHHQAQLGFYKTSFDNMSQEVVLSYGNMPDKYWNILLDLLAEDVNVKGQRWKSPVSLQDLVNALQLLYPRLVPAAPLAIKPPMSAASPSADSPRLSSDGSNRKPSRPTRSLRPRKHHMTLRPRNEKNSVVTHGRVQKRGSLKGKDIRK
jgi:hypothetical protein